MSGRDSRSRSRDKRRRRRNKRRDSREACRASSRQRKSSRLCYKSRMRNCSSASRDSQRDPLEIIIKRLDALEERMPTRNASTSSPARCFTPPLAPTASASVQVETNNGDTGNSSVSRPCEGSTGTDAADRIVSALSSLVEVKSRHYFISNFDPKVHDFDQWCTEVDRGRELNNWDDGECLGRIGVCLRGDARTWLNEWVTTDRTWSNFKSDFRSLCPRELDVASILYDVMSTSSSKFTTYADYARKSLLKLNIVRGLTDELKVAIVVRGITDPQVKAATANAKIRSNNLVEFLSVYVKSKNIPKNINGCSETTPNEMT